MQWDEGWFQLFMPQDFVSAVKHGSNIRICVECRHVDIHVRNGSFVEHKLCAWKEASTLYQHFTNTLPRVGDGFHLWTNFFSSSHSLSSSMYTLCRLPANLLSFCNESARELVILLSFQVHILLLLHGALSSWLTQGTVNIVLCGSTLLTRTGSF